MRAILGLLTVTVLATPGFADGCFMAKMAHLEPSIAAGDQFGLVVFDGSLETLVVQTRVEGDAEEFAWVVPTPSLVEASRAVELPRSAIAALVVTGMPRARPFGLIWGERGDPLTDGVAAAGTPAPPGEGVPGVVVHEQAAIGDHQITTLTASESGALVSWLRERDYAVPEVAEPIIAEYVQRGWAFTAVRMSRSALNDDGLVTRPLALTFQADEAVFPLAISSASPGAGIADIRLCVVAEDRVETRSHAMRSPPTAGLILTADPLEAYERRLARWAKGSPTPAFVCESAWRPGNVHNVYPVTELYIEAAQQLPNEPDRVDAEVDSVLAKLAEVSPGMMVTCLRAKMTADGMRQGDVVLQPSASQEPFGPMGIWHLERSPENGLSLVVLLLWSGFMLVGARSARVHGDPWSAWMYVGLGLIIVSPAVLARAGLALDPRGFGPYGRDHLLGFIPGAIAVGTVLLHRLRRGPWIRSLAFGYCALGVGVAAIVLTRGAGAWLLEWVVAQASAMWGTSPAAVLLAIPAAMGFAVLQRQRGREWRKCVLVGVAALVVIEVSVAAIGRAVATLV